MVNNLKIIDCELIVNNNCFVAQYCKRNNINTLGELIKYYDENILLFQSVKSEEEISGFVELIKYKYFDVRLSKENLLGEKIILVHDVWKGISWEGRIDVKYSTKNYFSPLRRLGFSSQESKNLLYYAKINNKDIAIIDLIINYKNFLETKYSNIIKLNKILLKKIDILEYYYNKYLINKIEDDNEFKSENINYCNKEFVCEEDVKKLVKN